MNSLSPARPSDERDLGLQPRGLFYLEHAIQDADGATRHSHYAPYLDYRPLGRWSGFRPQHTQARA